MTNDELLFFMFMQEQEKQENYKSNVENQDAISSESGAPKAENDFQNKKVLKW